MERGTRADLVKELARWLTNSSDQLCRWRKWFYQSHMILIILPAFLLCCLTIQGCDNHDSDSGEFVEGQIQNPAVPSFQKSRASTRGQGEVTGVSLPRIVAFGDSLTAGLGVSPEDSYPGQLAQLLREKGFSYEVINAGVSGDTSAGGLRRVDWVLKSQPRLVILELGANDGLRGQPLKKTYENLNGIIERLKTKGVIVVLAGMRLPLNYGDEYTEGFSDLFVRLAQEQDVSFIPFLLEGVAARRHLNQGDGIHPTAEGYSIVVQNVWKTIQPILQELADEGQK